jgi:hypothetical protein
MANQTSGGPDRDLFDLYNSLKLRGIQEAGERSAQAAEGAAEAAREQAKAAWKTAEAEKERLQIELRKEAKEAWRQELRRDVFRIDSETKRLRTGANAVHRYVKVQQLQGELDEHELTTCGDVSDLKYIGEVQESISTVLLNIEKEDGPSIKAYQELLGHRTQLEEVAARIDFGQFSHENISFCREWERLDGAIRVQWNELNGTIEEKSKRKGGNAARTTGFVILTVLMLLWLSIRGPNVNIKALFTDTPSFEICVVLVMGLIWVLWSDSRSRAQRAAKKSIETLSAKQIELAKSIEDALKQIESGVGNILPRKWTSAQECLLRLHAIDEIDIRDASQTVVDAATSYSSLIRERLCRALEQEVQSALDDCEISKLTQFCEEGREQGSYQNSITTFSALLTEMTKLLQGTPNITSAEVPYADAVRCFSADMVASLSQQWTASFTHS